MNQSKAIPVVDLFAGPGGLGEGFSSLDSGTVFRILVSAEMETSAHKTLVLRSFYRLLKNNSLSLDPYYRFCNGESEFPYEAQTLSTWEKAQQEAKQIKLGSIEGNLELNRILDKANIGPLKPWVLIGGPPCQAYSLVGRSRNAGKGDYKAEDDHRHFLYKEYLRIIQRYKPTVFVMENVKGILSAKVNGEKIFKTILSDLANPDEALGGHSVNGYKIYALSHPIVYEYNSSVPVNPHQFIVRSEDYGIPQARHRVILLGVRDDISARPQLLEKTNTSTVWDAINSLPKLRSKLSKELDSAENWVKTVRQHIKELRIESSTRNDLNTLASELNRLEKKISAKLDCGALRFPMQGVPKEQVNSKLTNWYSDDNLKVYLNHEARSHMSSDLRRYVYASTYASAYGLSPKGHENFDLKGLRPNHVNWETGKFSDRFRVQLYPKPATTVTSHISKDGHYFIHPDPSQCRSLTVREADRIQTFPDNYFFLGNRTQQFHQVGNAVPPLLAYKIAETVRSLLL